MNIGIIGSGAVGKTLAAGFAKHGYAVMIGTRERSKLKDWSEKEGKNILIDSFEKVAGFADIIVLAVKGLHAADALKLAGADNIEGKTIIDTTNPIDDSRAPENGVLHFTTSLDKSLMEELQAQFPQANFVKAFNSVGNARMVDPAFRQRPTMFICGNNNPSKEAVSFILDQFGWEVCDMGKAEAARAIEPLCMLWCIPGFLRNEWTHAFHLLKA